MAEYIMLEGSPLFGDLMGLTPDVDVGVYGGQNGAQLKTEPVQVIQGHEESSNLQNGLLGPLDFGWMDSNVDLLQFLTGEEVAPLEPLPPATIKNSINEADSAIAVEILKSVAEDTTKMLDSGSDPAIVIEPSSQDNVGVDWFDVLDEEVSQALAGYVVTEDSGPVLSPVTAEDVESILSSGSSSPSQELMETSSSNWVSISPMTLDSPGSNPQSPVFGEVHVSQSDLDCLLTQVRSVPGDHNYQAVASPGSVEGPSNSRPKPYSRKNNSRSSGKVPKETRQVDRHERKKQQNKDAALRYRLKKKQETDVIDAEVDILETRNNDLRESVEQMTREIKYLKNLLADVYKAKGIVKSQ